MIKKYYVATLVFVKVVRQCTKILPDDSQKSKELAEEWAEKIIEKQEQNNHDCYLNGYEITVRDEFYIRDFEIKDQE